MPRSTLIPDLWLASLLSGIAAQHSGMYLAGGRVRDWLLNRDGRDVDLCVEGRAIPLARRIANATDGAFYVLDTDTDAARILYRERGVVIDLAGLRGGDIIADLRARDLTINAMAVRLGDALLVDPPIIDPCQGRRDLEAQVLRATSQAAFRNDPVRMLRAVRLEAALGFGIEPQSESWLRRDARLLPQSSPERIRYELLQLLAGSGLAKRVRRMQELGLLEAGLPEVAQLVHSLGPTGSSVTSEFELTLAALTNVERLTSMRDWLPEERVALEPFAPKLSEYLNLIVCDQRTRGLLLRWATLVHRTGAGEKAAVAAGLPPTTDPGTGDGAARVTNRLHYSAQEIALVHSTVANARHLARLAAGGEWDRRDLYRYFLGAACGPIEPLLLAWASQPTPESESTDSHHHLHQLATELLTHYFLSPEELVTPPSLVSGADVMEWLGLEQGPRVGAVLRETREEQAMGRISTRDQAKDWIRSRNLRGANGGSSG